MPASSSTHLLLDILGRGTAPVPRDLPEQEWDALLAAASRQFVLPLLWHRLRERDAAALPPAAVQQQLADAHTLGLLRAEAWHQQLEELLAALQAHAVPAALLKGAFLAAHAYPSTAVRPMGDLDLLVPGELLARAIDALADVGYARPDARTWAVHRTHRHPPPLTRPGRLQVELHVGIEPTTTPFTLPLADVWTRAQPVPGGGQGALALAPEDLLLHLATHMGRSHLLGSSLVRVYDVAVWLERFGPAADWDVIVRRAVESGARRFVSTALGLTERLLDVELPTEVRRALHRDADDVAVTDAVALLDASTVELSGVLALMRPDDSTWARLRRVGRALLAPPPGRPRTGPVAASWAARGRRDTLRTRWKTVAHALLAPAEARAALQRVGRVRRLRAWAVGGG
jgi:hypothetical protein